MSETIDELPPIEWLRDLFEDASAASMYRWMMVAWVVAVIGLIALDRIGWSLQGRSKPRHQTPPLRSRLWRWRRVDPPALFTPLPSRTVVFEGSSPRVPPSIPLARSTPVEEAELVGAEEAGADGAPAAPLMLSAGPVPNDRFWRLVADPDEPIFGLENNLRLQLGKPPERYNPITDRIETIERDAGTGIVRWPRPDGVDWHGVGLALEDPPEANDDPPQASEETGAGEESGEGEDIGNSEP